MLEEGLKELVQKYQQTYGAFGVIGLKIFSDGSGEINYKPQFSRVCTETLITFKKFQIADAIQKLLQESS